MVYPYRESLLSQLHPGNQLSRSSLRPAVTTFEKQLGLSEKRRAKIIWRLDGGFGVDQEINWLLHRNYHLLAKGKSNRRANYLAQQVKRWMNVQERVWIGRTPTPTELCQPVDTFVLKYDTPKGIKHRYLYSTLNCSARQTLAFYNQRGGAETEFRADKSGGLFLHKRRKHKRDSREAWILLTDMAHNFLAWFTHQILANSPFAGWGPLRITRDLFRIPGLLTWHNQHLLSVKLIHSSPYADDLLPCLAKFWD